MKWGEKRWQYLAVMAPDAFAALAVVDTGYAGYAFLTAYDRRRGRQFFRDSLSPLGLTTVVAPQAELGQTRLTTWDSSVAFYAETGSLRARWADVELNARITASLPFEADWKVKGGGQHHTHKRAGAPVAGTLTLDGERLSLDGGLALLDYSRGLPARETEWLWSSGAGTCGGVPFAWNLRVGFGDPTQAENALWIDGVPRPCGPVRILRGEEAWQIEGEDLALILVPEGETRVRREALVASTRFRQPFGPVTGRFRNEPVVAYGVTEKHFARW